MEEKIKTVMADVFGVAVGDIDENFGSASVSSWDSAAHMRLIMALEEAFDLMFDDDEVGDLVNLKALVEAVARHQSS